MEDWVSENFRYTLCYSGIYFLGSEANLMLTPSGASRRGDFPGKWFTGQKCFVGLYALLIS